MRLCVYFFLLLLFLRRSHFSAQPFISCMGRAFLFYSYVCSVLSIVGKNKQPKKRPSLTCDDVIEDKGQILCMKNLLFESPACRSGFARLWLGWINGTDTFTSLSISNNVWHQQSWVNIVSAFPLLFWLERKNGCHGSSNNPKRSKAFSKAVYRFLHQNIQTKTAHESVFQRN